MNLFGQTFHALRRLSKLLSRRGLYPFLEQQFSTLTEASSVLSVGAGGEVNERLLKWSKTRGYCITQLDIDAAKGAEIVADICAWSQPDSFEAIVVSEVLEHVTRPERAIENLYASLKSGGRLILTTPFLFPIHDRPHDYYRYTRFGLSWLLRDFQDVDIRERNSWAETIGVLLARTFKSERRTLRLLSPIFVSLALLLAPLAILIGRLVPSNSMTTGYTVHARK